MLVEYPEPSIRPLKTNVGYERLLRPIQLAPQTEETYLEFSKFGRSTGGDFSTRTLRPMNLGPVAELVGIEGGVVSGVFNLESSDVGASDRRPRHGENYHEV